MQCGETLDGTEDAYQKTDEYPVPVKRRQRRERLHTLHCYVASTGIVAVAASASMLAQQVENMAEGMSHFNYHQEDPHAPSGGISASLSAVVSKFQCNAGYIVGSAAARVGEFASGLASAIGEPPQRVLASTREEQDAPLLLFWAINLCALCMFASLALFAIAFAFPVGSSDTKAEQQAVVDVVPLTVHKKSLEGLFRVVGVVIISLVSGCGLALKHPMQSALLVGL